MERKLTARMKMMYVLCMAQEQFPVCISRVLVQSHVHVLLKGLSLVCCVVLKNVDMFFIDFLMLFL